MFNSIELSERQQKYTAFASLCILAVLIIDQTRGLTHIFVAFSILSVGYHFYNRLMNALARRWLGNHYPNAPMHASLVMAIWVLLWMIRMLLPAGIPKLLLYVLVSYTALHGFLLCKPFTWLQRYYRWLLFSTPFVVAVVMHIILLSYYDHLFVHYWVAYYSILILVALCKPATIDYLTGSDSTQRNWRTAMHNCVVGSVVSLISSTLILFYFMYMFLAINTHFKVENEFQSKSFSLSTLPPDIVLGAKEICADTDLHALDYPVIFKANVCTSSNTMLGVIEDVEEARAYMKRVTHEETGVCATLMQEFHNHGDEFVIFYFQYPYWPAYIKSLGHRIRPRESKAEEDEEPDLYDIMYTKYNLADYATQERNDLITPELTKWVNDVFTKVPGFHVGRIDIKVESPEALSRAESIKVLEMNMVTPIRGIEEWDGNHLEGSDDRIWSVRIRQIRTYMVQLYIGLINIALGHFEVLDLPQNLARCMTRASLCPYHKVEHLFGAP